jgi:hypothetical protein
MLRDDYEKAKQYYQEAMHAAVEAENEEAKSKIRTAMDELERKQRMSKGMTLLDFLKDLAETPGKNQPSFRLVYECVKAHSEGPEALAGFVNEHIRQFDKEFFKVMENMGHALEQTGDKVLSKRLIGLAQQIREFLARREQFLAVREQFGTGPTSFDEILRMETDLVNRGLLRFGPYTLLHSIMSAKTLLARWQALLENADKFDDPQFVGLITDQREEAEKRLRGYAFDERERERAMRVSVDMEGLVEDIDFIKSEMARGRKTKEILARKIAEFEAARKLIHKLAYAKSRFEHEKLILDHHEQFDRTYNLVLRELIWQALDKGDRELAERYHVMADTAVNRLFFVGPLSSPELRARWEKLMREAEKRLSYR